MAKSQGGILGSDPRYPSTKPPSNKGPAIPARTGPFSEGWMQRQNKANVIGDQHRPRTEKERTMMSNPHPGSKTIRKK